MLTPLFVRKEKFDRCRLAILRTDYLTNGYLREEELNQLFQIGNTGMFKKLKELYNEYKPYGRVDLIMYGVLILSIILYFIFSTLFG
jgi:hypothetical protein